MNQAVVVGVVAVLTASIPLAAWLGYRLGLRRGATWLVRPHTPRTLARMPLPEEGTQPTVSQATFVRTNLPSSTSRME